jgi:hypothetical protein
MSARTSARIFVPGSLVSPIRGTVRYEYGEPIGIWGDEDNPICLMVQEKNGVLRILNRAERRLLRRVSPQMFKGTDE